MRAPFRPTRRTMPVLLRGQPGELCLSSYAANPSSVPANPANCACPSSWPTRRTVPVLLRGEPGELCLSSLANPANCACPSSWPTRRTMPVLLRGQPGEPCLSSYAANPANCACPPTRRTGRPPTRRTVPVLLHFTYFIRVGRQQRSGIGCGFHRRCLDSGLRGPRAIFRDSGGRHGPDRDGLHLVSNKNCRHPKAQRMPGFAVTIHAEEGDGAGMVLDPDFNLRGAKLVLVSFLRPKPTAIKDWKALGDSRCDGAISAETRISAWDLRSNIDPPRLRCAQPTLAETTSESGSYFHFRNSACMACSCLHAFLITSEEFSIRNPGRQERSPRNSSRS